MLARTALRAAQIGLAILVAAYLVSFADHARQLLGFAHPLDYGEGPLLAQVEMLRAGTPIWRLYADPAAPPYLIINYPPLYLLLCAGLSALTGLLAAPAAAGLWLLWDLARAPRAERGPPLRRLLALGGTLAVGGGLLFGLLQWASGGWFALHVVAANANRWDADLARGFWEGQIRLRWPLAAAALLALVAAIMRRGERQPPLAPALIYTLAGALTAAGVGKVGAYSNYFLELYAGLVWLVGAGYRLSAIGYRLSAMLLLILSLTYYPPLWDPTWPRVAGLLAPSPPRLAIGRYGLWADAARERDLLAAFGRVDAAVEREVRAAGPLVFTDMPGVAAAAGVLSRAQAFEYRQLLDQGLADQSALLADLASGHPPLAVIDYLGNWLTPEMIAIIRHTYAQDGSLGTFDLYRPVDAGPQQVIAPPAAMGAGLELSAYALAYSASARRYEPGELLTVDLGWRRGAGDPPPGELTVALQLTTPDGAPLLESELPLLYGALPPGRWLVREGYRHVQTLSLPAELPPGRYGLAVELRANGAALGPARRLAEIAVEGAGGRTFEETGQFVPAPIMRAWAELGGLTRAGLPLTPAVPFAWGRLQCFELTCLELRDGQVAQRPLGAQLYLGETIRGQGCPQGALDGGVCAGFAELAGRYGAGLGPPVSGELLRNSWLAQWTENARLERRPGSGEQGLGRLGEESLRLPPGEQYRWP
ncbi:hypothetical protein K2Z83_07460 [Oscillochloris sp. ZM17-4]|uniref:hypothetical protein n=1 Tax=Oscillochloris sp. ZM17-4 TaxID=2866714 RepID=UPI001C735E4F|nr:hypothetical protein [Oscillochloris sp. ZM17-4]MBX0327515.1 hypothetical protein [Oscillochloris sp. ZM17-4]